MSVYKSSELTIQPVVIDFNKPEIISRKLQEQAQRFIEQIEDDLLVLNAYISIYQTDPCLENLQNIEDNLTLIQNKYPDNVVALFPDYLHALHNILPTAIKQQKALLTHKDVSKSQTQSAEFTYFIEELSSNDFADLLQLFASKYPNDDDLEEALDELAEKNTKLKYLVDNYAVQYIDGNNGKVFQLTHMQTGENFIVRYGNRLNNPRDIEAQLVNEFKDKVPNPFPPLLGARQGSYRDKHGNANVCFLEIMPFYPQNLGTQQIKPQDANGCMLYACENCLQLGQILRDMQNKGFMHSDLKPSNILMDYDKQTKSYQIKLMDRKTVLKTNDGIYDPTLSANSWYDKPLTTDGISAPELDTHEKIDADKVHAYAIGINLFLASIRPQTYQRIKDQFFARGANGLNTIIMMCTEDFPGENGRALMDLIVKATQHDPLNPTPRPNVKEVLDELQKIKLNMEKNLRESCKLGIIELQKMIPIFQTAALREEFASIISEIERELDNPREFTLLTLEQFIYKSMGNILSNSLNTHLTPYFDNQLKENPQAFKSVQRSIEKAKPFRTVQVVIDLAQKTENLCRNLPTFNACLSLINELKKHKKLDYEMEDSLNYLENKLKGLLNIDFEENNAELFAEVMSEVLEIKLQLLLSTHLNLERIKQLPELQKELDLEIAKSRPFNSEAQVEALDKHLSKLNTKVYQQLIQEGKKIPDTEVYNIHNSGLGSKF